MIIHPYKQFSTSYVIFFSITCILITCEHLKLTYIFTDKKTTFETNCISKYFHERFIVSHCCLQFVRKLNKGRTKNPVDLYDAYNEIPI